MQYLQQKLHLSYCELIECSRPIRFFIVSLMYNNWVWLSSIGFHWNLVQLGLIYYAGGSLKTGTREGISMQYSTDSRADFTVEWFQKRHQVWITTLSHWDILKVVEHSLIPVFRLPFSLKPLILWSPKMATHKLTTQTDLCATAMVTEIKINRPKNQIFYHYYVTTFSWCSQVKTIYNSSRINMVLVARVSIATYVPVKSKIQHPPPPGHTPGIWHLLLPGWEGFWSPLIGGGEFDR